jgi:hypothetical protein
MEEFDSSRFDWGRGGELSSIVKVRGVCDSFKSQDTPGGRVREKWKREKKRSRNKEKKS